MHLGLSHLLSVVLFQILTKDSVTVFVNAIMYYKVKDATSAVANVDDYSGSAQLLAATTLRNVLGTRQGSSWCGRGFTQVLRNLGDILSDREAIAREMQVPQKSSTFRCNFQSDWFEQTVSYCRKVLTRPPILGACWSRGWR